MCWMRIVRSRPFVVSCGVVWVTPETFDAVTDDGGDTYTLALQPMARACISASFVRTLTYFWRTFCTNLCSGVVDVSVIDCGLGLRSSRNALDCSVAAQRSAAQCSCVALRRSCVECAVTNDMTPRARSGAGVWTISSLVNSPFAVSILPVSL